MSDKKEKRILIPWSTGVDSTVLVLHGVRDGYRVCYVHLKCDQPRNAYQVESERLPALKRAIIEKVQSRKDSRGESSPVLKPFERFSHATVSLSSTPMPYKQLPAWFMHLMSMIGKEEYEEVQMGYLLNDDAAPACADLAQAWYHLAKAIYGLNFKVPPLTFPLLRHRKHELIDELEHWGILDLVWWCELPQFYDDGRRPCEHCPSCIRHRRALEDKLLLSEFNRKFTDLAVNYDRTSPNAPSTLLEENTKEIEA